MFGYLTLNSLDLSNFDTTNVEFMDKMFYNMPNLESIELKYFRTLNVIDMSNMFADCKQLKKINIRNFNTEIVKYSDICLMYTKL